MRAFTFGSYNWRRGSGDGEFDRLRRQLVLLADLGADAWAFQGCADWCESGGRTRFDVEQILGLRGFLVPSSRPDGDLAIFLKESANFRVTAERHEHGQPFWHAVACLTIATSWPSMSFLLVSADLAPTSPMIRLAEAEALATVANGGAVIAGGSWNALAVTDPDPSLDGTEPARDRRTLDRSAAAALEEAGFVDVAASLRDLRPTVGHTGGVRYRADRIYSTFPGSAIVNYQVVEEYEPVSDHRPVVATFNLGANLES